MERTGALLGSRGASAACRALRNAYHKSISARSTIDVSNQTRSIVEVAKRTGRASDGRAVVVIRRERASRAGRARALARRVGEQTGRAGQA